MLESNGIDRSLIKLYVANEDEYHLYKKCIFGIDIIIGVLGIAPQKEFIISQYPLGKHIVFLDDDVESVDLSLTSYSCLDDFFKKAFQECHNRRAFILGVYPCYNPFFRKTKSEIDDRLNFIIGGFFGIINRPTLECLRVDSCGNKEDVKRSLNYWINDGIVLRFNLVGFKTKFFNVCGGLGGLQDRLENIRLEALEIAEKYGDYGYIKVRKNGVYEFVLKKSIKKN
jgi:hypothetical protein